MDVTRNTILSEASTEEMVKWTEESMSSSISVWSSACLRQISSCISNSSCCSDDDDDGDDDDSDGGESSGCICCLDCKFANVDFCWSLFTCACACVRVCVCVCVSNIVSVTCVSV